MGRNNPDISKGIFNPATSVTDTNGRFHHVANAYCADQSLFVNVGSVNPTLTGLTLARKVTVDPDGLILKLDQGATTALRATAFDASDQVVPNRGRQLLEQLARKFSLFVDGYPESQAELGVIFEKGIAPRGAAAGAIGGIGCGGQVPAVDGGTTRGIGHNHAVAE